MTYLIKRKYLKKLKTLGYVYRRSFKAYHMWEGDILHRVSKNGVYKAYKMVECDMAIKLLGVEHAVNGTSLDEIDMKPNVPVEWYVEKEK